MSSSGEFDETTTIGNTLVDHLYVNEFKNGKGKFFNIVFEENIGTTIEYSPPIPSKNRIKISVTFIKENNHLKTITLKKFRQHTSKGVSRWEEQYCTPDDPIALTHFSFQKLVEFLRLLTEHDLANHNDRRVAIVKDIADQIDSETQTKVRSLLRRPEGFAIIDELLRNGEIGSRDLVNIGYRKSQLEQFRKFLSDEFALENYGGDNGIIGTQIEKIWQFFFKKNDWIFGFGLDYKYLNILQDEAHAGTSDVSGRGDSITDFLMGDNNFTVLVEIKKHDTPIFQSRQNRAGSWRLSSPLIDSVSQILEQKASWQIKAESHADKNFDAQGNKINQKTADPKCILIIGSDSQFTGTEQERSIKLRTFELFRRDSRNIEILTFTELFNRSAFVVGHSENLLNNLEKA